MTELSIAFTIAFSFFSCVFQCTYISASCLLLRSALLCSTPSLAYYIIQSVVLTTLLQNVSSHKEAQATDLPSTPEDQEHTEDDLSDQQPLTADAPQVEVQIDLAQFMAAGGTEVGECAQRGIRIERGSCKERGSCTELERKGEWVREIESGRIRDSESESG